MAVSKKGMRKKLGVLEQGQKSLQSDVGDVRFVTEQQVMQEIEALRAEMQSNLSKIDEHDKFFQRKENSERLLDARTSLNIDDEVEGSSNLHELYSIKDNLRMGVLDTQSLQSDQIAAQMARQQKQLQMRTTARIGAGFVSGAAMGAAQTYIGTESARTGDAITQRRNQELMRRGQQMIQVGSAAFFLGPAAAGLAIGAMVVSEGVQEYNRQQRIDRENKTVEYKQQLLGKMSNNKSRG